MKQHNNFKKDMDLLSEAYDQVNEAIPAVVGMLGRAAAAGVARGVAAQAVDALTSDDSNEEASIEDAEGGVVYMVLGEADYEAPDIRGIYTDKEAAVEAAKGLQGKLPPDFDIGVVKIQLNTPLDFDTKREYVEYDSGDVTDPRADKSEHIGSARA